MEPAPYDYRNLQSLLGYAAQVHERSGAVCQLCGYGRDRQPDFNMWRQLTVEHLIGESQGGYLTSIRQSVAKRFPDLDPAKQTELVARIDTLNTITACSFCNATTSRTRVEVSMTELIENSVGSPEQTLKALATGTAEALKAKREDVQWKLVSVRVAFEERVAPMLGVASPAQRSDPPISNTQVGRLFQERVAIALEEQLGEPFDFEVAMPIGAPPKPHRFDLASRSRKVVVECKSYGWTASGNVPSAKITTLREAANYLSQLPVDVTKVLAVARAVHNRRSESLGEYFVRLNTNSLQAITVLELSSDGCLSGLFGPLVEG